MYVNRIEGAEHDSLKVAFWKSSDAICSFLKIRRALKRHQKVVVLFMGNPQKVPQFWETPKHLGKIAQPGSLAYPGQGFGLEGLFGFKVQGSGLGSMSRKTRIPLTDRPNVRVGCLTVASLQVFKGFPNSSSLSGSSCRIKEVSMNRVPTTNPNIL